jgi:hypothetical protein
MVKTSKCHDVQITIKIKFEKRKLGKFNRKSDWQIYTRLFYDITKKLHLYEMGRPNVVKLVDG